MNCQSTLLAGVASSLIFVTLNVAMNLYMKWLFAPHGGNFALPWTMLAVQQLETYIVLQPILAYRDADNGCGWGMGSNVAEEEKIGLDALLQVLAVTALFCLNVGLNSLSLVRISITLNQTVRAFLPVGILFLATILEQRTYPGHSYMTTALLVIGITLTCWGSPDFEFFGFALALASTLLAALGTSLNGRLLNTGPFSTPGKDKIMRLMMFQSVPAFFFFGAVAAWTEAPQLREMLEEIGLHGFRQKFGLVSFSSALALTSNVGRLFLVAATSALMETLAGNVKVAALCIIDNRLFGTALNGYNYAGVFVTFLGFSVHLLLQYATNEPEEEEQDDEEEREVCAERADELVDNRLSVDADFRCESTQDRRDSLNTRRVTASGSLVRGNIKHTDSMGIGRLFSIKHTDSMNRPRLISAADTGLASEHLALDYGRQQSLAKRRSSIHAESPVPVPALDLANVLEAPQWLTSPTHDASGHAFTGSFAAETDGLEHRYEHMPLADIGLHTAHSARSRCQTKPLSPSRRWLGASVWRTWEDNGEKQTIREAEEEELEGAVVQDSPPIELAPL